MIHFITKTIYELPKIPVAALAASLQNSFVKTFKAQLLLYTPSGWTF
jgi:hypothetical protein